MTYGWDLRADQAIAFKNFTPPGRYNNIELYRNGLSNKEVAKINMNLMPGFRFEWWYTGNGEDLVPDAKYRYCERTNEFVR